MMDRKEFLDKERKLLLFIKKLFPQILICPAILSSLYAWVDF